MFSKHSLSNKNGGLRVGSGQVNITSGVYFLQVSRWQPQLNRSLCICLLSERATGGGGGVGRRL